MTQFDIKRRFVLQGMGAIGAGSVLVACGGGSSSGSSTPTNAHGNPIDPTNNSKGPSAPSCSSASASIPIVIDASVAATGIPLSVPIYAYISGDLPSNGYQYLYDPAQSKPVQANSLGTPQAIYTGPGMSSNSAAAIIHYSNAWTNVSIPLDRSCATQIADLAVFNASNLPGISTTNVFSGRIWISVGEPLLPFSPSASDPTSVTFPAFDNTYGAYALYDWLEFSWDNAGTLYLNTTQVDQYGFPISATATGATMTKPEIGIYNKTRSNILSTMQSIGTQQPVFGTSIPVPTTAGLSPTAYPPATNTSSTLRMLSPKQWVATNTSTYLDAYVGRMLNFWTNNCLSVSCTGMAVPTYYGWAIGSTLYFYTTKSQTPPTSTSAAVFSFSASDGLNTNNILACNGSLASGSADQKNVGKALAAAFNRGVLTSTGSGTTYINIDQTNNNANFTPPLSSDYNVNPEYNVWSYNFHRFSADGFAYGFPYDDVGTDEDLTIVTSTTGIRMQLGMFN